MKENEPQSQDPRLDTPPGHFSSLPDSNSLNQSTPGFFSMRDGVLFALMILACIVVTAMLWLKPPHYISFESNPGDKNDPTAVIKDFPKPLKARPGYDPRKFEEISDDEPSLDQNETPPTENSVEKSLIGNTL